VVGGLSFRQIVAAWHTCGVTTDNKAYCWGKNGWELGSVAAGDDANQTTPRLVSGGLAFRAVDAHARHTCGVTTGAEAYCWGVEFQEGFPGSATPVEVPGGLQFRQVAAGTQIACGVTTDSRAYCWGGDMRTPYLIR
jgi:alpha-tubulin suppressor-like RCC1 family protein